MAKLFPSKQTFVDRGNGVQLLISKVTILSSLSDNLEVSGASDVALITGAYRDTEPTFYLTSDQNNVAIDGATVGTVYEVVTRHAGMVNFKADS